MNTDRAIERKRVTIQGISGCYHEIAARAFFANEEIEIVPCSSFSAQIKTMKQDAGLLGIMAIENTIAGSLLQNNELVRNSDLRIIGELKLRISHCLAALPNQKIDQLNEVNSHPIALMQCEEFLEKYPHIKVVEKDDTANSAKEIADKNIQGCAAICSEWAAQLYGLEILYRSVETNKRNFTRFLVLEERENNLVEVPQNKIDKSSIVFSLPHTKGSLSKVLSILSFYDINLTKIQSLPIIGREWEYRFYIDLTFDNFIRYQQSLSAIQPLTKDFKILGEYESCKQSL